MKEAVLDVAVDIRKGNPNYGQHVSVELKKDNHRQYFIPKGFAHGFAVLSEIDVFRISAMGSITLNMMVDFAFWMIRLGLNDGYQR